MFIILTAPQAAQINPQQDSAHTALVPILLADGVTYVLPVSVLTDPAHADWISLLSTLPQQEVAANRFVQSTGS